VSDSAYSVNMRKGETPTPLRVRVISPEVIVHVMQHPARGYPWTITELAPVLGCSVGTLSHMRTGARQSFPIALAERFSEAVGCERRVLFAATVSTESDTERAEAVSG
jgi:hypothetical protein